jgi:hypothetical protein
MKLTIATAALITSMAGFAPAATVNINAFIDINFTTNPAVASTVDGSYTAYVGSYTGGALTGAATFATINEFWTNVGSYTFATAAAGNYNGSFKGDPLAHTDALGLAGDNIWVWVTNGSTDNLLMQAINSTAGENFQFKADAAIPNSVALDIRASTLAGWELALGTFTTEGANASYGGSYVLNVVPEPSAALLGAFGAIGLLRRRRI